MAKKKTTKPTKKVEASQRKDTLPQNIVPFGERVVEDKNIYISQSAYKEIHLFTKDKTTNESGGVLLGKIIEQFGKANIVIHAFIEAKYCEATPTTLTFTHKTWEYIHKEAEKKYPDLKILGWIHTHPNFGIFLSEYDKFIQQNFFSEENQIAYVVDPIQNIEGFYFWINEKIERCKGFYVFDKTGVKISVNDEKEKQPEKSPSTSNFSNFIIGILMAAVIVLMVMCLSLNGKVSQQKELIETIYRGLENTQYQMAMLQSQIYALTDSSETDDYDEKDYQVENEYEENGVEGTYVYYEPESSTSVNESE